MSMCMWLYIESTGICMAHQAAKGSSVFSCFAGFDHYVQSHSTKALHMGAHCPFTGYHAACPPPSLVKAYNCECDSYEFNGGDDHNSCSLIHLSTKISIYTEPSTPEELQQVTNSTSELFAIAYGQIESA
jgi:hypothetical protein